MMLSGDQAIDAASEQDMADAAASCAGSPDLGVNRDAPKISVVMAAYNAASTLDRAIRSLVRQSERSWELIIVDDGSQDETALRAAGWASRNQRIRVLSQSNMGASQARNRGLREARGEWIVFFDADDTMDRRHFAMMLKAIRSSPDAGAAACGWARVDTKGRRAFSIVPAKDRFSFEAIYTFGPPTVIHAYLLPRRLLLTEGGFDVRFKTGEDWDLWIRLARMGLQFAVVPKILALYWDSGGSLTKDAERLLRDDIAIRKLARQPDARISAPLPEHANGIQRDNPAQDSLFSALYWGATLLGVGQNPRYLLDLIQPFRPLPPPEDLAGVLRAGLEMVAPGGRSGVIAHWPSLARSVLDFLQAFESWSQTPGLATAILDEVELECLRKGRFSGAVTLTHSLGLNLFSPACWRGVASVPPLIDRLTVKVGLRGQGRIVAKIPLFGPISGLQIQIAVARRLLRHVERRALGTDSFGRWVRRVGRLMPLVNRITNAMGLPRTGTGTLPEPLGRIVDQESDRVAAWKQPLAPPPVVPTTHPDEESANGWDRFYEQEDPWDYGNAYEQQKYDDTLELTPLVDGEALEIACSEGRFTEKLASKSERILAVDISAKAIARAARRCARFPDVKFKQMDIFHEELSGRWALIVCSEVLYYLPDKPSLLVFLHRLFAAVQPGGYFVHAHARSIDDDSARSGFDWSLPFGADFIAESLAKVGFVRQRTTDRDIYRIDLFQKPPIPAAAVEPLTTRRDIECVLPDSVAGGLVWRGAIHTRSEVESEMRQTRLPVLTYHRIAEDGPDRLAPYRLSAQRFEEQLIFLRRRGYRSCSPMDMAAGARRSGLLPGRPIMITFDDGYADFYETAWSILRRNGFSAHNFIVTERVGGHADWDAHWGPPAPLMSWNQIVRLSAQGATFGSHLATHTAANHLRPEALFREAVSSRLKLEKVLGTPIDTVATPFGESNGLVELVLQQAGYRQHFGNHLDCLAPISSNWLLIPRLFVTSDLDMKAFGNMIHMAYEPPEAADRPSGATAEMDCPR
jgi:peptidoglycan/xylan/chitin deacetylase (PgdA/CDA1 family)/GT2 family glycosyltransferase/2-polyprenyl-3-methyl-5-hydroxy-6-metoxy-1,4-benzoquinol methylase